MTTKKLLGLQLKRLLSSVAKHSNQHLAEVEADLLQTNFLLAEAIEKLSISFIAIHASVRAQQKMVDMLLAGEMPPVERAAALTALSKEIGMHINAAVTGLQFQDMTSQLIGKALQRVTGLSKVLATLDVSSSEMVAGTGGGEIITLLNNVNHLLEQQSGKLESDVWKSVCQTHMESGDVELF